jgi:hypothetical protein
MKLSTSILFAAFASSLLVGSTPDVQAQGNQQGKAQKPPPSLKGTVAEVKKKGRLTSLVIKSEAGGDPITVLISPKIQFSVEAKGDLGFLCDRQIVTGTGVLTNQMLFVKKWTVHVGPLAKRTKPRVAKAPNRIGQSTNAYDLAGMIMSRQQDEKFADYETLTLNVAQLKKAPVYIDKGATVTVSTTETDMIEEGTPVEYVQVPAAGGRVQIVAVRVLLKEALKSEEFFKEDDKKSKSKRRRTTSKKTG